MCLHVRAPNAAESKELGRWLKRPRNAVQMRRGQLISFSAQGMRVQEISAALPLHEEYVRKLIRRYNEEGLAALRTRARPGRPPTLTPEDESVVVEIATMPPRAFGQPFNQWSLRKLTDCLVGRQMIPEVSHVTIGKVLDEHKVTYQRTRTWKESKDPKFASKKKRINRLYKRAPKDTVVVCFDELGPVQIKPHAGSSWAPRKHPVRHRATYTRRGGVSYFFGAYNVHEDILWMHHKRKKHATVVLDFLKAIRCRYPEAKRIYVVMDNLSTHKTPTILQWCRHNQVSPVFTATNASWMNRLECHLTAAHYFVIKNSDPDDHRDVGQRMQEYLKWRNKNTQNAKLTKVQNSMPTL